MRLRLFSSVSMLACIFVVIASVILTTYFDTLVELQRDKGFFLTDNPSAHNIASRVLQVFS